MGFLGRRPRDLRVPEEREVQRRLMRTTSLVLVAFLVIGWVGMTFAASRLGGGLAVGVMGTLLLMAYGAVLGVLLFRAGQREVALIRTLSIFLGEAPIGIVFLDEAGHVTYANRAIERLTGRTMEEVAGKSAAILVEPDDRPRLAREMASRKAGVSNVYELRIVRADGGVLRTLVSALPFFDGDKYDGSLAAIIDVTELYAARSAAQRYQELSSFALDTVTHDLSNRMQEVITRAAIASAVMPTEAARARTAIDSLSLAADRAARLIREVKQIAAAEREEWPKRRIEVPALVARAIASADLGSPTRVEADITPEAAARVLNASDLAPLVLSKLLEQAAEGAPGEEPRPLRVEVAVEGTSPQELVMRVHGFARKVSDDDLRLMLAPPRELGNRAAPWRTGVKLAFASAVAQAHGWGLRAARQEAARGAVLEVRIVLSSESEETASEVAKAERQ